MSQREWGGGYAEPLQGPGAPASGSTPPEYGGYGGRNFAYPSYPNPGGGGDPFDYTGGSLLTPWTKQFVAPAGSGGGYSAPQMAPFRYNDLNFSWGGPGQFGPRPEFELGPQFSYGAYSPAANFAYSEQMPGSFDYAESPISRFAAPSDFVAPNYVEDPGYKFRLANMQEAATNNAAARGTLRGGDFQRALAEEVGNMASAEYGNAWQRAYAAHNQNYANRESAYRTDLLGQGQQFGQRAQAFDLNLRRQQQGYQQARDTAGFNEQNRANAYGLNWQTASGVYDRNMENRMRAHDMNQRFALDTYRANAESNLGLGNLSWQIASGTYDRNRQNAMDAWNSEYQMAAAAAAAGAANSNQAYNRALNEYEMEYNIFNRNQETQFGRLLTMANLGMQANGQMGQFAGNYAGNYGNNLMNAANARGAAGMAGANAWANMFGSVGDTVGMGFALGSPIAGNYGRGYPSHSGGYAF